MLRATRTSAMLLGVTACSARGVAGPSTETTGAATASSDGARADTASDGAEPSTGADVTTAGAADSTSGALDDESTGSAGVCPLHEASDVEVSFASETVPSGIFGQHFGPAVCDVVGTIGIGVSLDCTDPRDTHTLHRVDLVVSGVAGFAVADLPAQIVLEYGKTDGFEACRSSGLRLTDVARRETLLVVSDRLLDDAVGDWTAAVVQSGCTAWVVAHSVGSIECRPGALRLDTPGGVTVIDEGSSVVLPSGHVASALRARHCRWTSGGSSGICGEILYTVVAPRPRDGG